MIYTTGTIAINGNTVTGTGTDFSAPLSLIRVGCTLIAVSDPIQIFTITEIKNGTELSVTPSANPAIPAGTKFSILLSDSISVDGLAQDVAETLRYYQSKETEVAEALEWSQNHIADKIGLGDNYRDCPDISGEPANYVGFVRILESAAGFPSVASGEWCLTGWISHMHYDGVAVKGYSGIFVGYNTKSLYSYTYSTNSGASWARHARKDEVSRLAQSVSETALRAAGGKQKFVLWDGGNGNTLSWGVWDDAASQWSPLAIGQGGTGALDALTARNNLGVGPGDNPQFSGAELVRNSDETAGWVCGGRVVSKLLSTSGTQRVSGTFYSETNITSPSQATIEITSQSEGTRYFSFNTKGQILAETAILRSSTDNPLLIKSSTPTICFNEDGRPDGSPFYNLIFDGGNWRIQKNGDGYNGEYVISYNYQKNEIEVPKLKATRMSILGSGSSLEIDSGGTADETTFIQTWGNGSDRLSVFEVKLDTGYLFYAQKIADKSRVLSVNGKIECVSLSQSSDRDLKDNIKIISDATEAIRKMNGYTYTLKENGLPYAGVIAQEVMEAIPEAIGSFTKYGEELAGPTQSGHDLREETRFLSVDYAAVTGLLVQVARETDNRVTELEEENASLRANIAVMDERISKLEALVRQLTGSEE